MSSDDCTTCAGTGRLLRRTTLTWRHIPCPDCDGDGQVLTDEDHHDEQEP